MQSSALLLWIGFNETYLKTTHFNEQVARNLPSEFPDARKATLAGADKLLSDLDITRQEWVARQTYVSLGVVLNVAQELELDVCPTEGLDVQAIAQILAMDDLIDLKNEKVLVGMFVGKVDVNQPFHHAFPKSRKPTKKGYKIIE